MQISILIPAHNEEATIADCVQSCLNQTLSPSEVIVVNDGSTDNTRRILQSFGNRINVLTIPKATGNKSRAQALGIHLVTGDVVISTDADTILDSGFVEAMARVFSDPTVSAASGYIKSMPHNALTALREVEYIVGQDLYKKAQAIWNFVLVIPGCASAFRTELFHNGVITFEHDTLTEDLDFTYKLHRKGYNVAFVTDAIVNTQDPDNFHSYINQTRRWFFGGWQNLFKHGLMFLFPRASLILSLSYIEGILTSALYLILPLVNFQLFLIVAFFNTLALLGIGAYAAVRRKRFELFYYSPLRIFIQFLHSYIFLEQFFKALFFGRRNGAWFTPERRVIVKV